MTIPGPTRYTKARCRLRTSVHALLAILILGLLQFPASAMEHPIVILTSSKIEAYRKAETGALETLGYPKTVAYSLDGNPSRIPHVANQISLLAPRAIIAIGSLAALALKAYPLDAPVVSCLVVDETEALRLPQSWAISMHVPPDEAYDRIRHILPRHRIGIPHDPKRTGRVVSDLVAFFKHTSIKLVPFVVRSPSDLGPALIATQAQFDALWLLPDASFLDADTVKYLLRYSAARKLPLIGYSDGFTRSGALLSLEADYQDMGRQAAELARRVAAGEGPPRLHHPRHTGTIINTRVADRLQITLNPGLVALAERVYP